MSYKKFNRRLFGPISMPDGTIYKGRDFSCDIRTLTIPDVVPTLKEIVLSGSATKIGEDIFDDSVEAGVRRMMIQRAPLEAILNARFTNFEEVTEDVSAPNRSKDKETTAEEVNPTEQG